MRNAHNDNEPFTFRPIGAVAAALIDRLASQQNQKRPDEEREPDGAEKQRTEAEQKQHREYVESGLQRISAFERRARGD